MEKKTEQLEMDFTIVEEEEQCISLSALTEIWGRK